MPGPPPDGQLPQVIEVTLGTSGRIGEVLAIRKCDVDDTISPKILSALAPETDTEEDHDVLEESRRARHGEPETGPTPTLAVGGA
ncbi:MAG: hypothetical protein ACRDVZ_08565 [Jiangellaceae bacterium]